MNTITSKATAFTLATLLALALLSYGFVASAHDGEDHTIQTTAGVITTSQRATMETLLALLQQLVALLTSQHDVAGDLAGGIVHVDDAEEHELAVTVEEHGGRTHVHVYEHGTESDSFFLEGMSITDELLIVEEIAERTGLEVAHIQDNVTFNHPEEVHADEDAHGEDHDEDTHGNDEMHDEMDLSGIHIMADGTVMLGDGTALHDATITADGMILLPDGHTVEPAMDLR